MEAGAGIEPALSATETDRLPLSYPANVKMKFYEAPRQ